ncbi:MAG: metallophosphoesterase [Bryobacteraceae bacterium]|jgi:predicted MPP superfamily phosphohydrolase
MSFFATIFLILGASQLYWGWRGVRLARRKIASPALRGLVCAAILAVLVATLAYTVHEFGRRPEPVHMTLRDALLTAPFGWWIASSMLGFLLAIPFAMLTGVRAVARRLRGRAEPASPARRDFLAQTTRVVTAAPFLGGAYGLLYGRLNLETVEWPIRFANLPPAFHGFRIAQLSDIHIGPFMTGEQIRKFAQIANALKPDLIALTGDYVTFDAGTQYAVVEALAGLRAPFGVYGCLGNHDAWARVEDSISSLFAAAQVRMLRGSSVAITVGGDWFNLIGVDFQSRRGFGPSAPVRRLLGNIESLIARGQVNILLSHNPDTFDRAAALGIDLSMAGHTHGGQAALEFISPEIAPTRLVTPYVAGFFRKPGGQLYVNRGIGTIGVPIRIGAPPEITVYQLERG